MTCTNSSRPAMARPITQVRMPTPTNAMLPECSTMYSPPSTNTSSRMWPANMFAGHILLLVFVLGGEYMVLHSGSIAMVGVGILTWIMGLAIAGLELFVQAIKAYIFTVLTAQYIGSAIAEEH